jgi:DNA-directed RNA polymerase subunit M/transcription elongation factor TFIIS
METATAGTVETVAGTSCIVCKGEIEASRIAFLKKKNGEAFEVRKCEHCAAEGRKAAMKRKNRIVKRATQIVEDDEYLGICLKCESEQMAEPDAREYKCESCGERKVYGASEILFMA